MISVVTCSKEQARFESVSRNIAKYMGSQKHEIIRIADAQSLAEGYNRGLRQASGEVVIFTHDDVEFIGEDVPGRLLDRLSAYDVVGVAGTDRLSGPLWVNAGPPHIFGQVAHPLDIGYSVCLFGAPLPVIDGIQALDGLFIAFRREVIERVRWDEKTFTGFHHYDLDATFRAYRMGYRLAVTCELPVVHASGGSYNDDWKFSAQEFMKKHGAHLAPACTYVWTLATVHVRSRLEALQVMTPRYLTERPEF